MPYTLIGSKELTQQKILTIGFLAVCSAIISSNKLRGKEFSLYSDGERSNYEKKPNNTPGSISIGSFIQVKPLNIYENELPPRLMKSIRPFNYSENKYSGLSNLLSFDKKSQKQIKKTEGREGNIIEANENRKTIVAKKRCTKLIEEAFKEIDNQIKFDSRKGKGTNTSKTNLQLKKD